MDNKTTLRGSESVSSAILSINKPGAAIRLASIQKILMAVSLFVGTQYAALASEPGPDYLLHVGDVLSVKEDDEIESTAAVRPDGTCVINYAGSIAAAGKTVAEVEALVNKAAMRWTTSPHIRVTLARRRPDQVYVLGQVVHPGLYQIINSSNTDSHANGAFTITTVLERAGGLKENADVKNIHVTRLHPKQVIDVNLVKLMFDGNIAEDLVLQPGDVIYAPAAGTEIGITKKSSKGEQIANKVRVMGAVENPGVFDVTEERIELAALISLAGGFKHDSLVHSILVAHTGEDGRVITKRFSVNKNQTYDYRCEAGDIVIVESKNFKFNNSIIRTPYIPGLPNLPIGDFDKPYNFFKLK